jgi:hypothetical protein
MNETMAAVRDLQAKLQGIEINAMILGPSAPLTGARGERLPRLRGLA